MLATDAGGTGPVIDTEPKQDPSMVRSPYLVESDDEGRLAHLEHVDALDRLLLQAVHEVHDEHRNVAQAAATCTQVGEGLVTGRVDDQQARQFHVEWTRATQLRIREGGV